MEGLPLALVAENTPMLELLVGGNLECTLILQSTHLIKYSGVFEVADYELEIRIPKFKICGFNTADENANSYLIGMIFSTLGFLGSSIRNPSS